MIRAVSAENLEILNILLQHLALFFSYFNYAAKGPPQGSLELSGWTGSGQAKGNYLKSYSSHRYFVIKIAMP